MLDSAAGTGEYQCLSIEDTTGTSPALLWSREQREAQGDALVILSLTSMKVVAMLT